jgi:hypothetical protein
MTQTRARARCDELHTGRRRRRCALQLYMLGGCAHTRGAIVVRAVIVDDRMLSGLCQ